MDASKFVQPSVFLVGYTEMDLQGVRDYLQLTGQEDFLATLETAENAGVAPAEALVSMFAKLCYKSLVVGENANITQVRDIKGNLLGVQTSAHGSVFEHVGLNFIVTNCSRVYSHEQVRHRVGAAYSQTSGRYCRIEPDKLKLVLDPLLADCQKELSEAMDAIERAVYLIECKKGLRKPGRDTYCTPEDSWLLPKLRWIPTGKADNVDFDFKKKLTSAIRRIAPNGQTNEIAMTLNVRTLRHTIQLRTHRAAEWEIREIYNQIYRLCRQKWPLLFSDAQERTVDGLLEVYGMKMNPYEQSLADYTEEELFAETIRRYNQTVRERDKNDS